MTDLSCIVRVESDQLMKRAALLYGSILVMSAGSAVANPHGDQPKQAMFKTQQEAEAAAPGFGCEGHIKWGPCGWCAPCMSKRISMDIIDSAWPQ